MQINAADIPKFDISLVQRPLRNQLDNLHSNLQGVHHSLRDIRGQLKLKAIPDDVSHCFTMIASDCLLDQKAQSKLVRSTSSKNKSKENTVLTKSAQQVGSRMMMICEAIRVLFEENEQLSKRMCQLQKKQQDLPYTISKDINRVEEQLGLAQKNLRQLIKENRNDIDNTLQQTSSKFIQLEKNTLWKIKDCEARLETRVNQQFVKDSIRQASETLRTGEHSKGSLVDTNELDRISRLTRKLEDQFSQQSITNNGRFRVVQQKISNKLVEKDMFIKTIADIKNKIEPQIDELKNKAMQQKTFIDDNTSMIRNIDSTVRQNQNEIKSLKGIIKTLKMSEELQSFVSKFDIHKICEIDAALDRLRDQDKNISKELLDLKKLVQKLNEMRMSEGGQKKGPTISQGKLNREQIQRVVMQINYRNRNAHQNEVSREIEVIQNTIKNLEKGFARELKSIDEKKLRAMINAVDQYSKKEIMSLNARLSSLEHGLSDTKKRLTLLLNQEKRESQDYSLIGVKKLHPVQSCIGCVKK